MPDRKDGSKAPRSPTTPASVEGAPRVNFFRRRALRGRQWIQWGSIGLVGILFAVMVGAVLIFSSPSQGTDYIEIYITDVPGDFEEVNLHVSGVYVGQDGYPLTVQVPEFDILAYRGAAQSLKLASGYVPHGNHSSVYVVFARAEGILDGQSMSLPIPKSMLEVKTGFDLASTRAGAILLDIDMERSLVLTERGFTFQPHVGTLFRHDFDPDKAAPAAGGPGADLSKGGFQSDPSGAPPEQGNRDPPNKFVPGKPAVSAKGPSSSASVSPSGVPKDSDNPFNSARTDDPSVEEEQEEDPAPQGTPTPLVDVPDVGPEGDAGANCAPDDDACSAAGKLSMTAANTSEVLEFIVTFTPEKAKEELSQGNADYVQAHGGLAINKLTDSVSSPEELEEAKELILSKGGSVVFNFRSSRSTSVRMTPEQAKDLAADPNVTYVEEVIPVNFHSFDSAKEALQFHELPSDPSATGKGVGIAIIDTGVDATHPDLKFSSAGSNARGADDVVYENHKMASIAAIRVANSDSVHGHGTHVAGIMVGQSTAAGQLSGAGPTQKGLAPDAKLYAYGVGEDTTLLWMTQAYDDLIMRLAKVEDSPPIRVVQNSWSTGTSYDPKSLLSQMIMQVIDDYDVVVVFSAGNNGGSGAVSEISAQCKIPREGLICVGGFEDNDQGERAKGTIYFASSRGQADQPSTWPDLVAPATRIRSTKPLTGTLGDAVGSHYGTMSGTSVAAPMVSAAIALMYEANPNLVPAQVEYLLEQSAYKFTAGGAYAISMDYRHNGSHYAKGHGLLDIAAAVEAARNS